MTYTYSILDVSKSAFDEIAAKLAEAGYSHAFERGDGRDVLDMHGIALAIEEKNMGHHIDSEGRFQSDKHPGTPANRIRMNLENKKSLRALVACAEDHHGDDPEFGRDLLACLRTIHGDEAVAEFARPAKVVIQIRGGTLTPESIKDVEEFLKSKGVGEVEVVVEKAADDDPRFGA